MEQLIYILYLLYLSIYINHRSENWLNRSLIGHFRGSSYIPFGNSVLGFFVIQLLWYTVTLLFNYLSFGESGEQLELDQYLPSSAFTSVNDIVN